MFLLISIASNAQTNLDGLFATTDVSVVQKEALKAEIESFVQPLLSSGLSEQKLLRKTFARLHSSYLKKYEAYADFNEAFSSGKYDCLTATALFSHVLGKLNFSYEIIETNYHIFLMVQTSDGQVLLETTDRWDGFVTDKEAIAKRIGGYRNNRISVTSDNSKKQFVEYSFNLYQQISSEKLTGLLYFNQAVKAFNRQDLAASARLLEKANALYESPRCGELGLVLIRTVLESSMDEKAKGSCLTHLKNFWLKKSETVAVF
ncbi:MAG: hypothetical protein WDN75_05535 [Bacteroidota bacterium]